MSPPLIPMKPATWKAICYTIIAILLPWLFANVVDGRSWVTVLWWIASLTVIWLVWWPAHRTGRHRA